jgi:hypothetical protein
MRQSLGIRHTSEARQYRGGGKRLMTLQIALRLAMRAARAMRPRGGRPDTVRTPPADTQRRAGACACAGDARKVRHTACKEEQMATRRSENAPVTENTTTRPTPARARKSPGGPPLPAKLTPEARNTLIAEAAYLRAERRGFVPGNETDDWLAAEVEVDALLRAGQNSRQ